MANTKLKYVVRICKFADFGTPDEVFKPVPFEKLDYDEATLDGSPPAFSVTVPSKADVPPDWNEGDIVEILVNNSREFFGVIQKVAPVKSATENKVTYSGMHYYYARLQDTILTESKTNSMPGYSFNAFQFGRRVGESNDLEDGMPIDDIMSAVCGQTLTVQDYFKDTKQIDTTGWLTGNRADLSPRMTDASFENLSGWSFKEMANYPRDDFEAQDTTNYFTNTVNNTFSPIGYATNLQNPDSSPAALNGVTVYEIDAVEGTYNYQDAVAVYQDDVYLEPGDVLEISHRLLHQIPNEPLDTEAQQFGVRIIVAKNNTFEHPFRTDSPYDSGPEVIADRVGFYQNWGKLSGAVNVPTAQNYRIGFMVYYAGALPLNKTKNSRLLFDNCKIWKRGNQQGMNIGENKLQLNRVAYSNAPGNEFEVYEDDGYVETIDYFHGNENLTLLPDITGDIKVKVLGYKHGSYKPDFKCIWKRRNGIGADPDTVNSPVAPTTETETLIDATTGLYQWDLTFANVVSRNKFRLRFEFTGDGTGTAKVDYYHATCEVESFTREITYDENDEFVYRDSRTGLKSRTDSEIDIYAFPSELLPSQPVQLLNTLAIGFFDTPALEAVQSVLSHTLKPAELGENDVTGIPAGVTVKIEDSNWDFSVDNYGKVFFKKFIGTYYGKFAGTNKKEYSFRKKNLRKLKIVRDSSKLLNNITYVGEGVAGFNALTISGNEYIDKDSVKKYGMKYGKVTEKKVFDIYSAQMRALAVLRQLARPQRKVDIELLPGFQDEWRVGDIIYFRDNEHRLDEDFRVLRKKVKVDGKAGISVDVTLSTKQETVNDFAKKVSNAFGPVQDQRQSSSFIGSFGGTPKPVSRETPYILSVTIPEDANENLDKVLLDFHTEPISTSVNILEQDPGATSAARAPVTTTIPSGGNARFNAGDGVSSKDVDSMPGYDGALDSDSVQTTSNPVTVNEASLTADDPLEFRGEGVYQPGDGYKWYLNTTRSNNGINPRLITNIPGSGSPMSAWYDISDARPPAGSVTTDDIMDYAMVFVQSWNNASDTHAWEFQVRIINEGSGITYGTSKVYKQPSINPEGTGGEDNDVTTGGIAIIPINREITNAARLQIRLRSMDATGFDDRFHANGFYVRQHAHTSAFNDALVKLQNTALSASAAANAKFSLQLTELVDDLRIGYREQDGGDPTSPLVLTHDGDNYYERHNHDIIINWDNTGLPPASGPSGENPTNSDTWHAHDIPAHSHEIDFDLKMLRNANDELLFPTNIGVYLNDYDGSIPLNTVVNGNNGPVPSLTGIGTSETGDEDYSQVTGIGVNIVNRDISYLFKNTDQEWIPGTHYLIFWARGNPNQVNQKNLGIIQASTQLKRTQRV